MAKGSHRHPFHLPVGVELLDLRLELGTDSKERSLVGLHPTIPAGAAIQRAITTSRQSLTQRAIFEEVKRLESPPACLDIHAHVCFSC